MRFTHLRLTNWRNFREVDVELRERMFVVGANASGKSNLLDAFRFLRDVAEDGGGLQRAVETSRRGLKAIRSLHARNLTDVVVDVTVSLGEGAPWRYALTLQQGKDRLARVKRELVQRGRKEVLRRPSSDDRADPARLRQTHLEQLTANQEFRELAEFFASVQYAHLVPQLIRSPRPSDGSARVRDPFGGDFLEEVARTPIKQQRKRLRMINRALKAVLPQFDELRLERDPTSGTPHLVAKYRHWRFPGSLQREDQFSDGTLRLIGLLWALTTGNGPLLLEEPELSLHPAAVRQVPSMIARMSRLWARQVVLSTHSPDLLSDLGIDPAEVLLLEGTDQDSRVRLASSDDALRALARTGEPIGDEVLSRVRPPDPVQLSLFGDR